MTGDDWVEEPEPPEETPDERLLKVIRGEEIPFVLRRDYIEELLGRIHDVLAKPDDYSPTAPLNVLLEADGYLTALLAKLKPRLERGQQADQASDLAKQGE